MMMDYISQALLLLMYEKPYGDITIGEITKRAGVNRSNYYRHFETKDSIVVFYLDSIMKEYWVEFYGKGSSDFSEYLFTMFEIFFKHKDDLILFH